MKDIVEVNNHKKVFFSYFKIFLIYKNFASVVDNPLFPGPPDGLRARDIQQFYMKASEFAKTLSVMASL